MPFPDSSLAQTERYSQIHALSRGAAGQVYVAQDNLGRAVAVKELLPSHTGFQQLRETFENEARIQASLQHPNIIAVYHFKEDPQSHELYLVSEYANGGSLADQLQSCGPLPEHQALAIAFDICSALSATSAGKIIHRDVKPGNILLFKNEQDQIVRAKLGDFGVARDLRRRPTTVLAGEHHPATREYAAPEQDHISQPVDVRTDLYALGISLWESLTGTSYKALLARPGAPDLRAYCPQCRDDTAAIIRRATQANPALRYQTAQEMSSDLRDVLDGRSLMGRTTIGRFTTPYLDTHQPRPRSSSGAPLSPRMRSAMPATVLVTLLGIGAIWLALTGRSLAPIETGGVSPAGSVAASELSSPRVPCRFNSLIDCSTLVPVYYPGKSQSTASRSGTGEVQVTFRNHDAGSGVALQFAPELDVSGFTRLELVATAEQPFQFIVEYKVGTALEIVRVSTTQRFEQGTHVHDVPITYDGAINELVLSFIASGEEANIAIESLRLR